MRDKPTHLIPPLPWTQNGKKTMTNFRLFQRISPLNVETTTQTIYNELGGRFTRDDQGYSFEGSEKKVSTHKYYVKDIVFKEYELEVEETPENSGMQYRNYSFKEEKFKDVAINLSESIEVEESFPEWLIIAPNGDVYRISSWDLRRNCFSEVKEYNDYYRKMGNYRLRQATLFSLPFSINQ